MTRGIRALMIVVAALLCASCVSSAQLQKYQEAFAERFGACASVANSFRERGFFTPASATFHANELRTNSQGKKVVVATQWKRWVVYPSAAAYHGSRSDPDHICIMEEKEGVCSISGPIC
jgi:hypothetical protein